jgi:hypothetical protein
MSRRCNHDHLLASPFCYWDTRRQIIKTKGISEQAEKVGVEVSGGCRGECWKGGVHLYIGKTNAKVAVLGGQSGVNANISEQTWKQEGVGRQI